MSDQQHPAARAARAGTDAVQRRLASFAGMVAAMIGGIFALGGCAIAAVLGSGPSLLGLVAIVAVVALVCGLVVRTVVIRLDVVALGALLARRATRGRRR